MLIRNTGVDERMEVVRDVYNGWNDDENLDEIKKCPFCGGIVVLQDNGYEYPEIDSETGAYVDMHTEKGDVLWCECEECGATAKSAGAPEEAIANWNRRAE